MLLTNGFSIGNTLPKWGFASAGGTTLPAMPGDIHKSKGEDSSFGTIALVVVLLIVAAVIVSKLQK